MVGREESGLVVLSYHSWETGPETVIADVKSLRERGWSDVSLVESADFIAGSRRRAGRYFLVTSDDGSPEDGELVGALRSVGCPGVLFINIGRIEHERLGFYAGLATSGDIAVQDHGRLHRKQFISGSVFDHVTESAYLGGLEQWGLAIGMPICASSGEIARRRFTPDRSAMELAAETAGRSTCQEGSGPWKQEIQEALERKGLGYRRLGRFYVRGVFECESEFRERVRGYLREGREEFAAKVGRLPDYFAYPWWQGSGATDAILKELGYQGSFAGAGFIQRQDGQLFGIPRIPVGPDTPRPIRLDLPCRPRFGKGLTERFRGVCKTALGIR